MRPFDYTQRLADYRALLPYALLGLLAGVLSALIIIAFEALIDHVGMIWFGEPGAEDFESLPAWQRFALPVASAAGLGLLFSLLPSQDREVGIVHVLSRMHSHYGHLPLRNAIVQLFAGAIALGSGHSGGREGPGVHLGAAINSSLANRLSLPNNSQRILIACGTAGGIAVAFNTPLAGVIFAMEVIVAEYTVVGFTPVILAAVSATTIRHAFDTGAVAFSIPPVEMASLLELPYILLLGVVAGSVVSAFIYLLKQNLRFGQRPVLQRFIAAGLITGGLGILVPEVLGMGYDSLNRLLLGEIAPLALLALVGAKVVATACGVGLGLPVGVIGPSLFIGGCLGGVMGYLGALVFPELSSDPSLYVVIGMGAAMGAVLNAPLAAILAVVELTQNILVVFPSMLAIIAATLTTSVAFRQRSAHQTVLRHLQREIPEDPLSRLLQQTNVTSAMDLSVGVFPHAVASGEDRPQPASLPRWCLIERAGEFLFLVSGEDLGALLTELPAQEACDLTEQDMRRWSVTMLSSRSTLQEAQDALRSETAEAIVISDRLTPSSRRVTGVITRDIIERFYLGKV